MSIEQRLRDAFAQRASEVEPSPGALFEIQRRGRNKPPLKPVLLRPAFVLAGVALAALAATLLAVAVGRQPDDAILVAPPTPSTEADTPPQTSSPSPNSETSEPPPTDDTPTTDLRENTPTEKVDTPTETSPPEISTQTIQPPTSTEAPGQTLPEPPEPPLPPDSPPEQTDQGGSQATAPVTTTVPELPPCEGADLAESESTVTLYFSCDSRIVSLERQVQTPSLQAAVNAYLAGPTSEEAEAGFSSPGEELTSLRAQVSQTDRLVSVDFQSDFDLATANLDLLVEQLNATLFKFSDDLVLEYRIEESCAAFFALLDRSCEMHTSDRTFTSTLTASPIGSNEIPNVYRLATAESESRGALPENARLTNRRTSNDEGGWAEVVTPGGMFGWVNTQGLTAQPLEMTPELLANLESLARKITSPPGLDVSYLSDDGVVISWGADPEDTVVIPTEDASSTFWHLIRDDLGKPRPSDLMSGALGSLLWIGGNDSLASISFNTDGGLGEPNEQFKGLYYVSIYHPNVLEQTLPEPITGPVGSPDPNEDDETGLNLPPPIQLPEPQLSHRARISVMFDFLASGEPEIYGVEAVWSSLQ